MSSLQATMHCFSAPQKFPYLLTSTVACFKTHCEIQPSAAKKEAQGARPLRLRLPSTSRQSTICRLVDAKNTVEVLFYSLILVNFGSVYRQLTIEFYMLLIAGTLSG